jgi:hypothetical protein
MADPVADEWVTVPDDEWVAESSDPKERWAAAHGASPEVAKQFAAEAARIDSQTPMSNLVDVGLGMLPLGAIGKYLPKIPGGRLLTTGAAAAKGAALNFPIVGKPLREAVKVGAEAWKASAPVAAAEAPVIPEAVKAAAGPKLKLSAEEVAAKMREMYGSEKAGRMLYGQARPGVTATARTESIKRLTPQIKSTLPQSAQRAIERELASSTPEEAFTYASKAPNDLAKEHFGDLLRRTLLERR